VLLFIVAYFSGVVQSPMTAFILSEMTGCIAFTLLAAFAVIAYEASRRVSHRALRGACPEFPETHRGRLIGG
jgi:H+/Cl- antiporter ClcA